jgi:GNAT superfamily N-acetyltransferase
MAWLPERDTYGPERPTVRDIDALNQVFAESFTDRYRRDGLVGVRVPHLNPLIWRYAIEDAGEGAMVWRDGDGHIAAFNMVHLSGREGWMGPLAVRPDRQGSGLGKLMIRTGIEWLQGRGARTIGLETMPRTVENIGFYSQLGFIPEHLTITLTREFPRRLGPPPELLGRSTDQTARLAECRALTGRLAPGTDFSRELRLTLDLAIGDAVLVRSRQNQELRGFALWHSAPLAGGRPQEEVRVLKLVAEDLTAFEAVMESVLAAASGVGTRRVAVRCQSRFQAAYSWLIEQHFRVHWTDLRMTLRDHPEPPPQGVVLSNWEI